jgi:Family of unknown function (DUF6412)
MIAWFAAVLAQLAGYWPVPGHVVATPSGLITVAAIALTGVIISILAQGARIAAAVTGRPLIGRAVALREKSWSAAFQRQLNPDAPGRARPRAPSAVPAAA